MNFYVLTLFCDMINDGLGHSIIKRGIDNGIINVKTIDIRDFSKNKHRHVDDYCYSGGAGMIMKPEPVYDACMSAKKEAAEGTKVLYMSPQGKIFNQDKAKELAKEKDIILLCGHYEGIDKRVLDELNVEEISIGDFVLTGGELAAMVVIDAVGRLVPGVLGNSESSEDESFSDGLLEYPQYTRPYEFMGRKVPDVLLSGHHGRISEWKRRQSVINTFYKRPELLERANLTEDEKMLINELKNK